MRIKSASILKNLSAIILIVVYLVMVAVHVISDSFLVSNQLYLILLMSPFILMGLSLDYILRDNKIMKTWNRIIIQLMPLGIFIMMFVSTIFLYAAEVTLTAFNYLFWLFISLPFFMVSYQKDGSRPRILNSLIGTGAIAVAYMFLTTQTDTLNKSYGAIIILASDFFMLYVASGINRLRYIGLGLGVLNAVMMILLRYFPISIPAKTYGWDFDISNKIELLMISTFLFCILVRLYEVRISKVKKTV